MFLPLAITPLGSQSGPGAFEGSVTGRGLGGLRVWLVKASPMSAVRAPRHIRTSGAGDYLLALHVAGTAHAAQDGREVTWLGHLTIAEIATRWGFRSAAHFTRAFHARYGTTPTSRRAVPDC